MYAKVKKINTNSKIYAPMSLIIFGFILICITFGGAFIQYSKLKDIEVTLYSDKELVKFEKKAVDLGSSYTERLNAATVYYLNSGELIKYYDASRDIKLFTPSSRMKTEWEKFQKMKSKIENMKKTSQNILTILVFLFLLFGTVFSILLFATKL